MHTSAARCLCSTSTGASAASAPALPVCRKVVVQCREECRQLDADPRLASPSGAKEQRQAMEVGRRAAGRGTRACPAGFACPPV
jgi:hypothetical protein